MALPRQDLRQKLHKTDVAPVLRAQREDLLKQLDQPIAAMTEYFRRGCKGNGPGTVGVEAEHFVTALDGTPASFAQAQALMRALQQPGDRDIIIDGSYMGFAAPEYALSLEPACQIEISMMPDSDAGAVARIYGEFSRRFDAAAAAQGLTVWRVACHPTRVAADLPLIPKDRYREMDRYFRTSGSHGIQMMRATASAQASVDYFSEADFVTKYRAACILAPLFALLTDNAPVYEGGPNTLPSVRTRIWQDVDPDRCGVVPCLMDADFGFAAYAAHLLQQPLIVAKHDDRTEAVGCQSAAQVYGGALTDAEIEHILSMFFYDVRLKHYIEIRSADCVPEPYLTAYAQLILTLFSCPKALNTVGQRFAGVTVQDIEAAKTAICKDGYKARVYGSSAGEQIDWLMDTAFACAAGPAQADRLRPLAELAAARETLRERNYHAGTTA